MEGRRSRTTTKKKASSSASTFTSVAAQLLLRRGGREAANGDSIEFFSDLRKCQPEPRVVSGQTERGGPGRPEDGRGMTRRRGSSAGSEELSSSEIGKHDYDWLLTPPATPLRSRATSSSGLQASIVVPNQLARAGSASYAKCNSRLDRTTGGEKGNATSRLARSSSVTQSSSPNTPTNGSSGGHLSHVRTLSSASVSSINTARSNASVSSTPLVSTASSPRTPVAARSAWPTARPCRRDKASGKQATGPVVARQPRASSSPKSSPGHPAPTWSRREHATPSGVLSPRSTTSTSQQVPPTPSKRANTVARSRLGGQGSGTGSTAQASSSPSTTSQNRDVRLTRGARAPPSSSSDGIKTRAVPAASTTTQQRWRQSLAPAIAAARSARREDSVGTGAPRNSAAARKISADKAKAMMQRAAAGGSGLARTTSRPKSANSNAPTKDSRQQDAKLGGGAPAKWKPALQQWTSRSVSSMSRLGRTSTTSEASAGSICRGQSTPENDRRVAVRAVATTRIASGPDAFPSTRYDAMLLREDPKNLAWLRGCDEGNEGLELVDGSLEPFDVATGF